jgi:hypothetical protein
MPVDLNLLSQAFENPGGLWFSDACKLATQLGWIEARKSGSHIIFFHPGGTLIKEKFPRPLNLQEGRNGKAKAYQVRQMLDMAAEMGII